MHARDSYAKICAIFQSMSALSLEMPTRAFLIVQQFFWQANVLTRKEGFLLVGGLINLLSLLLTEPSVREYVNTSVDVCGWVDMWVCVCISLSLKKGP